MSFISDTEKLLQSGTVCVVRSATVNYATFPASENGSTVVTTATCLIFPIRGGFSKPDKGYVAESTHVFFARYTSTLSVNVSHRIHPAGETDYYEVLEVKKYEDHGELITKRVEGK